MTYEPRLEDYDPDPDVGVYGTVLDTVSIQVDSPRYVGLEDPWYFGTFVYNAPGAGDTDLVTIMGGAHGSVQFSKYEIQIDLEGTEDMLADDSFPDLFQTDWDQGIMHANYEDGRGGYYRFTLSFDHVSPIPFIWDVIAPADASAQNARLSAAANKTIWFAVPMLFALGYTVLKRGRPPRSLDGY